MQDRNTSPQTEEQKAAKEVVSSILDHLNVKKVIFIDDSFEAARSPEEAIGWFEEALVKSPQQTASLLSEVNFDIPDRGWVELFVDVWINLDSSRYKEIVAGLAPILGRYIGNDLAYAIDLKTLFPRKLKPVELGPTAWEAQRDSLLSEANPDHKILCLFDQDLKDAVGFTSTGSRSGIGLLKAVTEKYTDGSVICGLLSHLFTPEVEMAEWRRYAHENSIKLAMFLPISKERLKKPLSFASAIKTTTLNIFCEQIKDFTLGIIDSATSEAKEDFQQLDVYNFEQIIVRSSEEEGISEVETLLRVFQIFHQDRVKKSFLSPGNVVHFGKFIEEVRSLGAKGEKFRELDSNKLLELRNQEMFVGRALVNAYHSPLQSGDLFQIANENNSLYILLGQPCDLMVRSNGERGDKGHDKLAELIPIARLSQVGFREMKASYFSVRGSLPHLYADGNDVGMVEFNQAQSIRLDVVDLVVLNSDGDCSLDMNNIRTVPPQFHKAWQSRYELLIQIFKDHENKIKQLMPIIDSAEGEGALKEKLRNAIMPTPTLGSLGLTVPSYSNGRFDFGLKRIGRLREPWASRLLSRYMRFKARDADHHDFSR